MLEYRYPIKADTPSEPMVHLVAIIQKLPSNDPEKESWGASAEQYIKEAVANVKQQLKNDGFGFNKKLSDLNYSLQQTLSSKTYIPELDMSFKCDDVQGSYYQNLIGVLR